MSVNTSLTKSKRRGAVEPTELDWARLAAYIDGEGCITSLAHHSPGWKNESIGVVLSVHNTDVRLIDWCAERWGGRVYMTEQTNKKWSTSYGWRVTCRQAAVVLKGCLPYFIIKREQAEVAIAIENTKGRWGAAGAPPEVFKLRWELKNDLSALKGKGSRVKRHAPRIVDGIYKAL